MRSKKFSPQSRRALFSGLKRRTIRHGQTREQVAPKDLGCERCSRPVTVPNDTARVWCGLCTQLGALITSGHIAEEPSGDSQQD